MQKRVLKNFCPYQVAPEVDLDPPLPDQLPQRVSVLLHPEQDRQGSVVLDASLLAATALKYFFLRISRNSPTLDRAPSLAPFL